MASDQGPELPEKERQELNERQFVTWRKWFFLPQKEPIHPEEVICHAGPKSAWPRGRVQNLQGSGMKCVPETLPDMTETDTDSGGEDL